MHSEAQTAEPLHRKIYKNAAAETKTTTTKQIKRIMIAATSGKINNGRENDHNNQVDDG